MRQFALRALREPPQASINDEKLGATSARLEGGFRFEN
jgi:hypothetical protein